MYFAGTGPLRKRTVAVYQCNSGMGSSPNSRIKLDLYIMRTERPSHNYILNSLTSPARVSNKSIPPVPGLLPKRNRQSLDLS